jgi:hypothetical protein
MRSRTVFSGAVRVIEQRTLTPVARPCIVALLAWYDEDPAWLERCVRSLSKVPVDHLIAIDGAYALYPDGRARSDGVEYDAISMAARSIGLTIHTPGEPWAGNEIEKRNRLFELAENVTEPTDWYLVIDADEEITDAPSDIYERLTSSVFDVGAVTLTEPGHPLGTVVYPTHPKFFRALRGLRCVSNHFTYQVDGRKLWGNAKTDRLEPRLDLTDVKVMHHKLMRHSDRKEAAMTYYRTRDDQGIEDIPQDRMVLAQ